MSEKQRHTVVPRTICLIFNSKDEVLLIDYFKKDAESEEKKKRNGIINAGGGHVEKGEDIIECANREIEEEYGIKPENTKLKGVIHVSGFFGKEIMMFITMSNSEEADGFDGPEGKTKWIKISEISKFNIFEDLEKMILMTKSSKPDQQIIGKTLFDGNIKILEIDWKLV